jgi:hypothetical protein
MVKALILIAYLVLGIVVASTHHYLSHLGSIKAIAAAVLAVLLWPLVLLGVNLHLGTTGKGKKAAALVASLFLRR